MIQTLTTTLQDFVWTTLDTIIEAQWAHPPPSQGVVLEDGVYCMSRHEPIWVPDDYAILQLRLSISARTWVAGHRGTLATEHALADRFM